MIIGRDITPDRQFYNIGALVLEVLSSDPASEVDLYEAFERINARHEVSANVFLLALDWLFLLGAVSGEDGRIRKCF